MLKQIPWRCRKWGENYLYIETTDIIVCCVEMWVCGWKRDNLWFFGWKLWNELFLLTTSLTSILCLSTSNPLINNNWSHITQIRLQNDISVLKIMKNKQKWQVREDRRMTSKDTFLMRKSPFRPDLGWWDEMWFALICLWFSNFQFYFLLSDFLI